MWIILNFVTEDPCHHTEIEKCLFAGASDVLIRNGIIDEDTLVQVLEASTGPQDVRRAILLLF